MLENLYLDSAQVKNGTLTLTTAGQPGSAVYQQLNAQISNLTPKTASPFTVSAQLPGGGALNANGTAGPFNQQNNAATPVNAQVTLQMPGRNAGGTVSFISNAGRAAGFTSCTGRKLVPFHPDTGRKPVPPGRPSSVGIMAPTNGSRSPCAASNSGHRPR